MKVLLASTMLLLMANQATAQDISGSYMAAGTNLDGSSYSGEAQITMNGKETCEIVWTTGSTTSGGFCMQRGNAVAAAYELGDSVGLVIYLIKKDGTLNGTWTLAGKTGLGTEILTRK